jgi:hypothetical protein
MNESLIQYGSEVEAGRSERAPYLNSNRMDADHRGRLEAGGGRLKEAARGRMTPPGKRRLMRL